ncbi:hypothetical protein D3C87_2028600 [compost metagenome]
MGDCLTHDRTADAEGLCQNMFGRQFLARSDAAIGNFPADLGGNARRQMLTSSDLGEIGHSG